MKISIYVLLTSGNHRILVGTCLSYILFFFSFMTNATWKQKINYMKIKSTLNCTVNNKIVKPVVNYEKKFAMLIKFATIKRVR